MARSEEYAIRCQGKIIDVFFNDQSKLTRLPYRSRSLDHSCDRCDLGCGHNMINYSDHHTEQYASINTNDMNRYKSSDEN